MRKCDIFRGCGATVAGVGGRGGEKKDEAAGRAPVMRDLVYDTHESSTVLKAVGSHVRSYLQLRKAALCAKCQVNWAGIRQFLETSWEITKRQNAQDLGHSGCEDEV